MSELQLTTKSSLFFAMESLDLLVKKRIYVGNLPYDVTEDEIRNKFNKFGNVLQVDLKYRNDSSFDVGLPCFAFLDLKIKTSRIDICFKKLSQKPWREHMIKLELARESLMSRLEKERTQSKDSLKKDTEATSSEKTIQSSPMDKTVDVQPQCSSINANLPVKANHNHESTLTKSTKCSMKQKNTKLVSNLSTDHKKLVSEEKRKNSVAEKKKSFLQQKEAIKIALSSVDQRRANNRIVFGDEEEMETSKSTNNVADIKISQTAQNKPNLFDEDEDDDDESRPVEFHIKKQFEGKKGQKLLELQSHYANDQRFSLDERFYESDDGGEGEDSSKEEPSSQDEYKRQMEILQSIVGQELPNRQEKKDLRGADNFMLRFDPTIADHNKYEIKASMELEPTSEKPLKRKKKSASESKTNLQPTASTITSTEKFYKVSEDLKESLKSTESSGFSLLKMFGSNTKKSDDESEKDDNTMKKIKISRGQQEWSTNPFKYDSSESEEEAEEAAPETATPEAVQQPGTWRESFFFKIDDIRLQEGLEFFSVKSSSAEDFDDRRRDLKRIVQSKVKHNLRKSQPKKQKLGGNRFMKPKRFKQ